MPYNFTVKKLDWSDESRAASAASRSRGGISSVESVDVSSLPERAIGLEKGEWDRRAADIKENGVKVPIIVDKANTMVWDGVRRLAIARSLGIKKVPVVRIDPNKMGDEDLQKLIGDLKEKYNG